jgi:glycosyltransferase involved in cell wall biosynthesis
MLLYNGRTHLLKRAIESVLKQSYSNWELILQDDCSTDGTFEMAIGFAFLNKRVRLFRNKTNLGIVKNRATAFRNTTGELICHVDNDDFIYSHALETMVKTFRDYPDIGLAHSDMAHVDENGEAFSYQMNTSEGSGWRHFGVYSRTAYNSTNGYNEELTNPCEDGDLLAQITEKFPIRRVSQVLYAYRNAGDHASKKVPPCKECTSRGKCNYLRVWATKLPAPADREWWQNKIAEVQNG